MGEAVTTADAGRKLYLIGFMGSGKSAVGECLARLLGRDFVDLDRSVETETGLSIAQVFREFGEEEFRRLESAALSRLAATDGDFVMATGGGTAMCEANVDVMRSTGVGVWLDPSFELILERLGEAGRKERPLFGSVRQARELYEQRRSLYAKSGLRVGIARADGPDDVAERIRCVLIDAGSLGPAGDDRA